MDISEAESTWLNAEACSRCDIPLDAFSPDTKLHVFPCGHIACDVCWVALYNPTSPRRTCKKCKSYVWRPPYRYTCGHQVPTVSYRVGEDTLPFIASDWFLSDGQQIGKNCQRCVIVDMLRGYTRTVREGKAEEEGRFAYACVQGGSVELHGMTTAGGGISSYLSSFSYGLGEDGEEDMAIEYWDEVVPQLGERGANLTDALRSYVGHLGMEPNFVHDGRFVVVFRERYRDVLGEMVKRDIEAGRYSWEDVCGGLEEA